MVFSTSDIMSLVKIENIQQTIEAFEKQGISLSNARVIKTGKEVVIYYVSY